MNLLTDVECKLLDDNLLKKYGTVLGRNSKYELCTGKKHSFPKEMMSFKRTKKRLKTRAKDFKDSKKRRLKCSFLGNSGQINELHKIFIN